MISAKRIYKLNRRPWQILAVLLVVKLLLIVRYFKIQKTEGNQNADDTTSGEKQVLSEKYPITKNLEMFDWHNYEFMKYESERTGNGEQGRGYMLTDPKEIEIDKRLELIEGINVFVSDKISVNRSVQDTRPKICGSKKYLKKLPSASVVIIFYDEWMSLLLRTIHSVYNRTPHKLLKELILVNDCSTKPELDLLETYVRKNFDDRVKVLRLQIRKGLIVARIEGAKVATGEVLVFLDSHMEVNVNWLPPLLEPIALSPTTASTPTIDQMDPVTFENFQLPGVRGLFDDFMWYQWFYLHSKDAKNFDQPHRIPVMLGCAFAIRRDFFYDLGMYDEGLKIWNGEQIELSLKLHLCGGDLVEVHCSRVSHTFRSHHKNHFLDDIDVTAFNFRRVAEVWLDEYKQVLFQADLKKFDIDPGDLTKAKRVKNQMKCKPFQYFLDYIEPEMYSRYYYQLHFPGFFAWGGIRSDAFPNYCVESGELKDSVNLKKCSSKDIGEPRKSQFWKLTWHRKLRLWFKDECLQQNIVTDVCQYGKNREFQDWKYDLTSKQMISFWRDKWCLTASLSRTRLHLSRCNSSDITQKWTWGNVNDTALENFDNINWENNEFVGFRRK